VASSRRGDCILKNSRGFLARSTGRRDPGSLVWEQKGRSLEEERLRMTEASLPRPMRYTMLPLSYTGSNHRLTSVSSSCANHAVFRCSTLQRQRGNTHGAAEWSFVDLMPSA
jgi:hypothetical protein